MIEADSVLSTPRTDSSLLSRRHALAALAVLPMGSIPAAAASADAELIALGKQFEVLVDAYYVVRQPWSRALSAAHRECDVTSEASLANPDLFRAACERNGVTEASDRLDSIAQEISPIANAILALPVTSIEGLRAKALVAFREVSPLGAGDSEYYFDNEVAFQRLFDAVAQVCGLTEKVLATGYVMPWPQTDDDYDGEEV